MTEIPTVVIERGGTALPDAVASDGSDLVVLDNDGSVVVNVVNGTGGEASVSFMPQASVAGVQFQPEVVVLADGDDIWCGPWPPVLFNTSVDDVVVHADAGLLLRALRF